MQTTFAAQKSSGNEIEPVDVRLAIVKPMAAKWMIDLYDYFVAHPPDNQEWF